MAKKGPLCCGWSGGWATAQVTMQAALPGTRETLAQILNVYWTARDNFFVKTAFILQTWERCLRPL